ncbi:peroxidase P7-like [Carex rostrata]
MAVSVSFKLPAIVCFVALLSCSVQGQLSPTFYATKCKNVERIVRSVVAQAVAKEPRMGASLLRLFFHDCFVQGCDASILLDEAPGIATEKNAFGNINSARGFEVIDAAKQQVERVCRATVSCADILALAARDSVSLLGGPNWQMPLGRRDSRTANIAEANQLPAPFSSLSQLTANFRQKGLNFQDLTVLSGAHSVGSAICSAFKTRVWGGDGNVDTSFALQTRQTCPASGGDTQLTPLTTPNTNRFSNQFYKNLVARRGLLHSDQELFNGSFTDALVRKYSTDAGAFFRDFSVSMVKLGNIRVLTGQNGEVRLNCRKLN